LVPYLVDMSQLQKIAQISAGPNILGEHADGFIPLFRSSCPQTVMAYRFNSRIAANRSSRSQA
jgi:hypothetical protein